jgi:hypothetical protein
MDEDQRELVIRLCTRAGMMMEDVSLTAITLPSVEQNQLAEAIARIAHDVDTMKRLISAASGIVAQRPQI